MEKQKQLITLTHINIRESISILLLKIIALDFIAATMTILFFSLVTFSPDATFAERVLSYRTFFFVLLGIFKIGFTISIVLLWLNEYFEITPTEIIHKTGILFQDERRFRLEYIRDLKLSQGILGRLLNFGTIALYDIREIKREELYLIHNPHRYFRMLQKLTEDHHEVKHVLRPHLFTEDDGEGKNDLDKGEYKNKIEHKFT